MATITRHKSAPMRKPAIRTIRDAVPAAADRSRPQPPAAELAVAARGGAALPPPILDSQTQSAIFEQASRLFHSGGYAAALNLFEQAATGPMREMAHSARLHARMCQRRLSRPDMSLRTPDEHYDYAVALINERKFEQAERHLLLAIAQTPKADHLFYALALCRGLAGDIQSAYGNLRRAIELHPRNRAAARNDPDFAEIGQLSPLAELLYPERAPNS
jgi:tetratricopeptide (TPR) repeat protein